METFYIIIAILSGALVGALITALILQSRVGKVTAQVDVLQSRLNTEGEKAVSLMQEKERAYQSSLK